MARSIHTDSRVIGRKSSNSSRREMEYVALEAGSEDMARATGSSLSRRRAVMTTASSGHYKSSLASSSNYLVTLSIAMLALSMIQSAKADLSCVTSADCAVKGIGHCKQRSNGEATCVYTSCAAGFWGAGNTYTDCFECPSDMTSFEGKAFYNTDCFIPCGESQCFMPEAGYAECSIDAATATPVCFSTCNRDGFVVANPDRPYATCVPDHQMNGNRTIVNQSQHKVVLRQESAGEQPKRVQRRTIGRRIRKSADLRSGPAVALLEHAGEDPFALVSK